MAQQVRWTKNRISLAFYGYRTWLAVYEAVLAVSASFYLGDGHRQFWHWAGAYPRENTVLMAPDWTSDLLPSAA